MEISIGKVERKLYNILESEGALYFVLVDPEDRDISQVVEKVGDYADAVIVGGSIGVSNLDQVTREIKRIVKDIPVILFPGNVDGLTPYADAVFFMSLMNSTNTYWTTLAPTLGAPTVKRYSLEPIPMAYIGVEPVKRTAVGFVGEINEIPQRKPKIAAMYCLSARYFGMRWAYLEAGSGAEYPVSDEMIKISKEISNINIIVGGGIRTPEVAYRKVICGADAVVTGTVVEGDPTIMEDIRDAVKRGGKEKLR
ncbi:MAG TPA: geranylgeranylglyceryl/heptaprenylglyceryl phosphate synthase [Methanothermococcus okinawensis]|uniref:Geranylgeranylglyceryl phosphate synthase n=1 Tax=Methanothermococcus okinawensis TaxID=155863 RepID=A0A832ZBQ0_9EURY|nr:geranylgeranylglyceryl/heptaprenylglyceryl phosphate synthase [Methanothermococcus okinawensis]HIP90997.1 geranylgeranylglyceryl/heptaprenylglyceryl phosphate synthase [Methanothermococcus okinawensis]